MKIKLENREVVGKKVKALRAQNIIPATIFGPKVESINVQIESKVLDKVFAKSGFSKFIDVEMPNGKHIKALIKEITRNPLKDTYFDASFYAVDDESKITVEVPVIIDDESPAVKQNLGFLVQQLETIRLHCLPKDLPENIHITIASLEKPGDSITVGDIKLEENVDLDSSMDATTAVAYIASAQKEEVEETPVEEAAATEGSEAAPANAEVSEGGAKKE